jgi:hypothetical protein
MQPYYITKPFTIVEIIPFATPNMSLISCKPFSLLYRIKEITTLSFTKIKYFIDVVFSNVDPISHKNIKMRNPNPLLEHVFLCKNEAKTNL